MFSTDNTYKITLPGGEEIVFGSDSTDTDWVGLVGPNGVTSSVELRESKTDVSVGDGQIIGQAFWGGRSIVADIFIPETNPQTRTAYLQKLQRVTKMIRTPGIFSWTEKDSGNTQKQIPVRLQSFPTIAHDRGPAKTYQIVMTALQPHIETATLSTSNNNAKSTLVTVNNPGDWQAYPYLKIDGPFTFGQIKRVNYNNTVVYQTMTFADANVSSTQYISIYTAPNDRRILREGTGGTINYYDKFLIGSDFIQLEPGNNYLILDSVPSGEAAKLSISWRGAWL